MQTQLVVDYGACSEAGRKPVNQDAEGGLIPAAPTLSSKGVAFAIADGISSSDVSDQASRIAITRFLDDYYHTPIEWSVKSSVQHVLLAINSWLNAQTFRSPHRFDKNRGFVCTFSALVIKSRMVHIFHLGDTRIYRVRASNLAKLTEDHRFWGEDNKSYLARALGMSPHLDIDYSSHAVEVGDTYLLMSDGVYEHLQAHEMLVSLQSTLNLNDLCKHWVDLAHQRGSTDNLTVSAIRVLALGEHDVDSLYQEMLALPFAPSLEEGKVLDGYYLLRALHHSHRSHVYLARDEATGTQVVLKFPATDLSSTPEALQRFYLEEWIAKRINHRSVLRPFISQRQRQFLYSAMHYVPGQTLQQWMFDHPNPPLEKVRHIVTQIANALEAFHRLEMVYQDLQPQNIIIDEDDNITIIDFGAVSVAGLAEMYAQTEETHLVGTIQYAAPELFIGDLATAQSDIFALGAITYQLLTGRLPYGTEVSKVKHGRDQSQLYYREIRYEQPGFPAWVDDTIARAVHPLPEKRYALPSEFAFDLRKPNPIFLKIRRTALIERNPLAFWKGLSLLLVFVILLMANTLVINNQNTCAKFEQAAQKECIAFMKNMDGNVKSTKESRKNYIKQ
ncbi:MAG: bifunctional protein-serine/threonine kinase/phosphatase [Methylophilus sp.]|nr:bifunctional protein-serine/threonine kinase/phosphatase [Methylophilus sp.]